MPYKSDAQRKFFHAAEARGEISKKTVDEFDHASKGKKLPEHKGEAKGGGKEPHDAYGDMTLPSPNRDERPIDDKFRHKKHGASGSHEDTEKKRKES